MGDAAPPGPARALATSALLAGASPVACGQCELQGVGRQVWLCLKGVGSRRNLAQRGPGWLGVRDPSACRSPRPLRATSVGRRKTAGPRPRLSPRRYVSPASQVPSFCHGPGLLARQGREKRVGGLRRVVGPAPERAPRGRACNRCLATDAGATARRREYTAEAGTPPNSIVVRWTRRTDCDRMVSAPERWRLPVLS